MYIIKKKLRAGVIGATGMVGQRFLALLENHPYFDVTVLAASSRSAGQTYAEAVAGRWKLSAPLPECYKNMRVMDAADITAIGKDVDFVFCAVDMPKNDTLALEETYAKAEIPVVSNNSANRWTPDVPMLIPEINSDHLAAVEHQKKRLGTKRGFIVVKPNCSIQSYVPQITPLMAFEPQVITAATYQAISGAGKSFADWPEMTDNVIPYIGGEEEKSEKEPLRIWGKVKDGVIIPAQAPRITTQCIRVPVTDGHMAAVFMSFKTKPTKDEILTAWADYKGQPQLLGLPSAPRQFITYFDEDNRPQTKQDRDIFGGMGVSAGRLREDSVFDWKFVGLSHNTLRGAAGGSLLTAELLAATDMLG
ncbi:MAG: aspartate-semialdehyde dehydrogenase [Eubacteriales bacterium]|nr:aspartate-semialdehyde dehydrogenase [Eubacteriales bacterium]